MEIELTNLDESMKEDIKRIKTRYSTLKKKVKTKYKKLEKKTPSIKKPRKTIPKSFTYFVWDNI
jgi:flagellar capping protein FliD